MGLKAEQFTNTSKNFKNVTFVVTDGSLAINKIDATFTGESKTVTYTGSEQSITGITAKGLIDGHTYEGLTYAAKGTNVGEYKGEFSGTAVIKDAAGNDVTKNYNVKTEIGKLTISKAEIAVTFTGESKTVTYTGSEQSITGITPTGLLEGHTYSGLTYIAKGTDAGTYDGAFTGTVVIKDANGTDVTENYAVTKTPGKLTISPITDKVTVTITGNTDTKPYNGTTQTVTGYTFNSDNKFYTENCVSFTGIATAAGITAGKYDMNLKPEHFSNKDTTNFTNVEFVVTDGWLKITPLDALVITAKDATKPYDGKPLTESGFDYVGMLNKGDTIEAVVEGTITDAGEAANVVTSYKIMHGDVDVTAGYGEATLKNGTLTVTPRSVIMTSANDEKPYDGTPLTNNTVTVTGDGFIEGEGATYAVTGTQTDAGESDNTFTFTLKDNTKAENYKIELVPGKLKVTPISDKVTVTITGNTDTKPYNGEKQSVKDYEVEISNKLYTENCFSFTGSAVAEGTDAGIYMMGLKAEQFTNTSKNFTNVEFAVTDGKLEISKRSVIMTSANDEKFFDGEPLTNDTVTVTGDGFIEGEGASYDVTGTQTKTGESDNTFRYKLNDNTKADNYKIEVAFGKLVVKQLLEKEEHFNYVVGYPDGTIRPEGKITRAEVAAIFFRLLTDDARAEFDCRDNDFTDVEDGAWYNRSISTLAKAGILSGYLDGTFKPNAPITRAEMASIIARFDKLTETGKTFNDIEGHWAQKYIELAATKGWLSGDGDGNFRPNDNIKRDETFAMINRVLERQVETVKDLLPQSEMNMWIDNMDEGAWYYKDVQEATNYHKCERIDQSIYEKWTAKIPDIDWVTHQF